MAGKPESLGWEPYFDIFIIGEMPGIRQQEIPRHRVRSDWTICSYLPILRNMRRKPGRLVPLELSILAAALQLKAAGTPSFHGFLIARELRDREQARLLTAHGTLYRALNRLQDLGYLDSVWEDPDTAAAAGRPRRRLYEVTATGRAALVDEQGVAQTTMPLRPSGATAP